MGAWSSTNPRFLTINRSVLSRESRCISWSNSAVTLIRLSILDYSKTHCTWSQQHKNSVNPQFIALMTFCYFIYYHFHWFFWNFVGLNLVSGKLICLWSQKKEWCWSSRVELLLWRWFQERFRTWRVVGSFRLEIS